MYDLRAAAEELGIDVDPEPIPSRPELDRQMREALIDLGLCSHAPAANPQGSSSGRGKNPGGGRPPGELGAEAYARLYGPPFHTCTPKCTHKLPAPTDECRHALLLEVRAEVKSIRGYGLATVARPAGETAEQLRARIVAEGEGWSVREAAVHFRCGEQMVIRARRAAGREPEYGRAPAPAADAEQRRARALELEAKGCTLAQIARILGVHRTTVERDLGRRAA